MVCPSFDEAVQRFRDFLREQGRARDLLWLTSDDVLIVGRACVARIPRESIAIEKARKRYGEGVRRGLGVQILAFCAVGNLLGCQVSYPADRDEAERQLMPPGLKLSLCERLYELKAVGSTSFLFLGMIGKRPSASSLADSIEQRA
jgi:hypothetical protein